MRTGGWKQEIREIIRGAYGQKNTGDDTILRCIISSLGESAPISRIRVLSRKPVETRCDFLVDASHMFNFFPIVKQLRRTRLFISGGGTLINSLFEELLPQRYWSK